MRLSRGGSFRTVVLACGAGRLLNNAAIAVFAAGVSVVLAGETPRALQFTMLPLADRDARLAEVAVEAAQRGPVAPVPLVGEGTRAVGALYDRFHIGVLIVRARMAAGEPADAGAILAHPAFQARGTVIVAYPINCEGQPNQPVSIKVLSSLGGPVGPMPIGDAVRGGNARDLLPGVALPESALVQSFRNVPPIGVTIDLGYSGPVCRGAATSLALQLQTAPSKSLLTSLNGIKPPADLASLTFPATVRLQVLLDATGRARFPHQVQGPIELGPAAMALLESRTFEPTRINGVAVPSWEMVPIVFTTTGSPATPEPFRPPPMAGSVITVEGRPVTYGVPAPPPTAAPRPVPPAPPGQSDTQLAQLAIEIAQQGALVPIPLDAAGPPVHGVLFDRFLIGVLRARAAAAAGTPIDPATASPSLVQSDMLVVAFPLACAGGIVAPTEVQLAASGGAPAPVVVRPRSPDTISGSNLASALPGAALPNGAVARAFVGAAVSQGLEVRVVYGGTACPGNSTTVTLPIQWVRATSIGRASTAKLPPDASHLPSPTPVQMRGLVDLEGRYRFATLADGPGELAVAAQVVASTWRFQPYRANGVPVPQFVISPLTFTTTGAPEPMGPPGAPGSPPTQLPAPAGTTPLSNSTVGGRAIEMTSPDAPGLTVATSTCAIAEDVSFGFTPAGAINVGGGASEGPARARRYLARLRGPAGQGLRIVRLGTTIGPEKTILDIYQVTYADLSQPLRVYVDQYREEPLKAPKGLLCAG